MVQSVDNRVQAKQFADRGFSVFPLVFRGKNPATKNGFKDATKDHSEIDRMWRSSIAMGVGIATGLSDLFVLDIDTKDGKQGQESWDALKAKHGWDEDTYTVRTWSGGTHLYFLMPDERVDSSQSRVGKGLDVRADGGYVVAPPTQVREGDRYGTYTVIDDSPILECPEWLAALARKPVVVPRERTGEIAPSDEVEARVRALSNELADIPEGDPGEEAVNRNAYMAGQYVGAELIEEFDAIRIMLDGISGWTWKKGSDEKAFQQKIVRAIGDGQKKPYIWEASKSVAAAPLDTFEVEPFDPMADDVDNSHDDAEEQAERLSMWATDNGQGVYLKDRVGDMLYAPGVGWMLWDGKRWEPVDIEFIQQKVSRFYRQQFEKALDKYKDTMDDKMFGLANAFKTFMSANRLGSILNSLKVTDGVLVRADRLDSHPDLLNTQNGIVDLRTGNITRHDRKMLMTKVTKAKYEPGYKHDDWQDAQKALPVDVAEFMQLRLGQAITGRMPESDDFIFMQGGGSNGKSSWASEGVLHAIGDYGKLAQPSLVTKVAEGATPERAGLRGTRYVLIEELPEGKALSIAEVKRIVGTATITARNLYEKEFTFDATHTLFITTNFMPPVSETDEGSWRRMCKVVFPYEYVSGEPQSPNERKGDGGLKARIKEGKTGQHEAILAWLIEGAIRYYADPSRIMLDARPDSVKADTLAWRKEADRILAFLDEHIVFDPNATVVKQEVFNEFSKFLELHGNAKWSMVSFMARLQGHKEYTSHRCSTAKVRTATTPISRPELPEDVSWSSAEMSLGTQVHAIQGMRYRVRADDV